LRDCGNPERERMRVTHAESCCGGGGGGGAIAIFIGPIFIGIAMAIVDENLVVGGSRGAEVRGGVYNEGGVFGFD
jgi:hypothetical protein